jgi:hypothetical protein
MPWCHPHTSQAADGHRNKHSHVFSMKCTASETASKIPSYSNIDPESSNHGSPGDQLKHFILCKRKSSDTAVPAANDHVKCANGG